MINKRKNDFMDYGIRVFRSRHREIRALKRIYNPSIHGFRVWPSSWLLMDYFRRRRLTAGSRVLDIGCGWGLAGIYCAKNHDSIVTCVDRDAAVMPYARLHARINNVDIHFMEKRFEDLTENSMKSFEIMIGSDICFWYELVDSIKGLILRALESGMKRVIIADPGRPPFERLGQYFMSQGMGEIFDWAVESPHAIQGRILRIHPPE